MARLLKRSRCPSCAKLGKDRKGDNLGVYEDQHHYCFSCGYYKPAPVLERVRTKLGKATSLLRSSTHNYSDPLSYNLPAVCLQWLNRYGITPAEIHTYKIAWNPAKETLVLPYYQGEVLRGTDERYFGTGPYPKYLTTGDKHILQLFAGSASPHCVLCEDYISAIKIARQYRTCSLRSSHISTSVILNLLRFHPRPLLIWLDRDKAREAVKFAEKARQYIPFCGTIISEKDPKAYNNEEISEFVLNASKGFPET